MRYFFDTIIFIVILMICTLWLTDSSYAQVSASDNSPEQFKFSFSERFRLETWDNAVTLSRSAKAGSSYTRNRTSIMEQWIPDESFEAGVKLTNEFRNYLTPTTNTFHMNEVFFDLLYIKWNTKKFLDGTLTLGRQNITLGEGFLVMDGNPLDGSRSGYFNAIRYDLNLNSNNNITFWGTYLPKTDKLPVINGNDIDLANQGKHTWNLIEQSEAGGGLYYTAKLGAANVQSYYMRKDYIEPDKSLSQSSSGLNTIGCRLNYMLNPNFSTTLEGAYQFGRSADKSSRAYGGYAYFDCNPMWQKKFLPATLTAGMTYLSGDDPSTKDNEGWDPIFSRWPKWSDSYAYTLIKEFNKVAYWSNFASVFASLKFGFDEQLNFNLDYHHLMAPQLSASNVFPGGTGHTRGDLMIAKLLMNINKNLSGHLLFEHFIPGSYYFSGADASNWTRIELTYKF